MKLILNKVIFFMQFFLLTLQTYAQYGLSWKKYQYPINPSSKISEHSSHSTTPTNRSFFNVDWQVNGTICNDFVGNTSGWGAHFEAGYYLTDHWALGAFLSFHTNNEYFPRQSFMWENAALSTDQQHSLFQLPFGISTRYRFFDGIFAPYAGLKMGAQYAESESYLNETCIYNDQWGFYISPEVGIEIHPLKVKRLGFHVAVYYSYATNDNSVMWYNANGLNNYGLRLGIAF